MQYQKVKSVAKSIQTRGPALEDTVLRTMRIISDIVGGTLGPGGQQVLIERQEHNLAPMVTKDGVTVYRSLGFDDAAAHCVMEAARDASIRTASEAGDGTTTATILSESIVRRTKAFCKANPRVSPQKVVRRLEKVFRDVIEPTIRRLSMTADMSTDEGRDLLKKVATISANGDVDLADAVMTCFDLVGDDGNVTITEMSGPSKYEVEKIEGFPVGVGYEESCGKFYPKFVNDQGTQRCVLEKPVFILYHGKLTEYQTLLPLMEMLWQGWQGNGGAHNVVLVATGFSEQVLNLLAMNFPEGNTLNVFPLLAPQSPFPNGQLYFLQDLAAITGAKVLDPLNAPLELAHVDDLGPGVTSFESNRFRSNIVGKSLSEEGRQRQEDLILLRVDELQSQRAAAESELERIFLDERIGKITGGIARLKVIGASNGELKEKRDRADDAVCAVRGAIKHGCLPGGGWTLLKLTGVLRKQYPNDDVVELLARALMEPFDRLLENIGISQSHNHDEYMEILLGIVDPMEAGGSPVVYNALEGKHVDPVQGGVLDSTPAVLEAIRNSISIASLLGTLGGTVVFKRDTELERREASDSAAWLREANSNPADERA